MSPWCTTGDKDWVVTRDKISNSPSLSVPLKQGVQLPGSARLTRGSDSYREWFRFQMCSTAVGMCLSASFSSAGNPKLLSWEVEDKSAVSEVGCF